jgi:hypothetical protein
MGSFYDARAEANRKRRDTPDRILAIARAKGIFVVSWRYRDDWLRARCAKLVREGKLKKVRGEAGANYYEPVRSGTSISTEILPTERSSADSECQKNGR